MLKLQVIKKIFKNAQTVDNCGKEKLVDNGNNLNRQLMITFKYNLKGKEKIKPC